MTHRIIPRAEWGARPATNPQRIAPARRRAFVVHYDGDVPTTRTGPAVPRGIQSYHQNSRGWSDIGYNFVIDQSGAIFEGRGWDVLGAHAGPSGNVVGIGVQVHIGGAQQPSPAALDALAWLYAQANAHCGRRLELKGHCDYISTSCPGRPLLAIVRAGLKTPAPARPSAPAAQGRPVVSARIIAEAARRDPGAPGGTSISDRHRAQVRTVEQALTRTGWLPRQWAGDGHYGTSTILAAKRFQFKHSPGTNADGILGPKELGRLFELARMSVEVTP